MFDFPQDKLNVFLDRVLLEDIGTGDITTNTVIAQGTKSKATMIAREEMVLAGISIASACFLKLDPNIKIVLHQKDGESIQQDCPIMTLEGKAHAILTAERVALNLVQHLSAIATLTQKYVCRIKGTSAILLDTRKTTPGLRVLEKYATRMGGAENHRMGLYDAIMIKDNHIAIAGGISKALKMAKTSSFKNIVIECDTIEQVKEALAIGADRLLLDNMTTKELGDAVTLNKQKIPLEASGGVTLETIHSIAKTGVNYISVGRITQSALSVDIGLDFIK